MTQTCWQKVTQTRALLASDLEIQLRVEFSFIFWRYYLEVFVYNDNPSLISRSVAQDLIKVLIGSSNSKTTNYSLEASGKGYNCSSHIKNHNSIMDFYSHAYRVIVSGH